MVFDEDTKQKLSTNIEHRVLSMREILGVPVHIISYSFAK